MGKGTEKEKELFAVETKEKEIPEAASLGCWTQNLAITFQFLVGLCVYGLTKPKCRVWSIFGRILRVGSIFTSFTSQLFVLPLRLNDVPSALRSRLLCMCTRVPAAVSRREVCGQHGQGAWPSAMTHSCCVRNFGRIFLCSEPSLSKLPGQVESTLLELVLALFSGHLRRQNPKSMVGILGFSGGLND